MSHPEPFSNGHRRFPFLHLLGGLATALLVFLAEQKPLGPDELGHALVALGSHPWAELIPVHYNHLLTQGINLLSLQIFGVDKLSLRFGGVLFGVVYLGGAAFFLSKTWGKIYALAFVVLHACHPVMLWYLHSSRGYSAYLCGFAVCWFMFLKGESSKEPSLCPKLIFIFLGLLMLTHPLGWWSAFFLILVWRKQLSIAWKAHKRRGWLALGGMGLVIGACYGYFSLSFQQAQAIYSTSYPMDWRGTLASFLGGLGGSHALLTLLWLGVLGGRTGLKKEFSPEWQCVALHLGMFVVVAFVFGLPFLYFRYLVVVWFLLVMMTIKLAWRDGGYLGWALIGMVGAVSAFNHFIDQGLLHHTVTQNIEPLEQVVDQVNQDHPHPACVKITHEPFRPPLTDLKKRSFLYSAWSREWYFRQTEKNSEAQCPGKWEVYFALDSKSQFLSKRERSQFQEVSPGVFLSRPSEAQN